MDYPKVAIIIVNWNGLKDTIECIESVKKIDYPDYEIIVIDNGSEKFDADILEKKFSSEIGIIRNKENLGFAGGNNIGIRYALENGADFVLLLNNDTVVDKGFLSEMIRVASLDNRIGAVGPKIYFYSEINKIWFAGGKINKILTKGEMIGYGEIDQGRYDTEKETDFITGCCLLVKREVFEKIGLLSEEYFVYYEDTDWCLRARKSGFKCVYAPKAEIWHKASIGLGLGSPAYIYYNIRNGLLMAERNGSMPVKTIAYLDSCGRMVKQVIKYIFFPSKRVWAKYIFKGIEDFYLGKTGKTSLPSKGN